MVIFSTRFFYYFSCPVDYIKQYRSFFDSNILLLYKGKITFNIVMAIIEILEERIDKIENDRSVKRKFYSASTEALQNMVHHMNIIEDERYDYMEANSGMIMVIVRRNYYKIVTGNYIPSVKRGDLEQNINLINSLDKGQLKALYRRLLSESHMNGEPNAGLGLIDIARKTGQNLKYNFNQIDDTYSYFNFEVKIPTEPAPVLVASY